MSLRLTVRDEELRAYLAGEPSRNTAILEEWKLEGSRETENQMRIFAPIRTGTYRESIGSTFTPKGFMTWPNVPYAKIVEEGSAPHIIKPKNAKALRWHNNWGAPIFARRVKHPGTEGQHVVRRTAEQIRQVLAQLYRMIWRKHH